MVCEKNCKNVEKMQEDLSSKLSNVCGRCKSVDACFFSKSEAFCSQCFMTYFTRKFHKTMDVFLKSRDFPQKNKVLIAISTGASLALVKLLSQEQHTFIFKTYFSTFSFIHIEEDNLVESEPSPSYIHQKINEVFPESLFFSINLKNYILSSVDNIKLFFDKASNTVLGSQVSGESIRSIDDILSPLLSSTSRADILRQLRNNIIYDFSEKNGYNVIIWGDTATSIASKVISETAKGRGYSIPWETHGKIKYANDIWLLRPMKDLTKHEVYFFLQSNGIKSEIKKVDHKITTIDELVNQYIDNLEKSNPNFIFTIYRTASKLQIPKIENTKNESSNFCFICKMPKENNIKDWIEKITINKVNDNKINDNDVNDNYRKYNNRTEDICYGCFVMLKGAKEHLVFPCIRTENIHQIRNSKDEVLSKYLIE
ncbi:hypothetical protein PORY_000037 [Pneumocystis oryctolagi]|uniref:Uncharacterized protein n=1 Tax=Pneumocystis oryctolagi TaxID=42067 RepID=A0ACB7CJ52_9ASCO|nr:hypothetical protein PORY_000037 [Pneumocystis oryctolagi]